MTMFSMVSHLSNSLARLSLRLYAPYRSSGEYRGGIGFPVAWPQCGQMSFRLYRLHEPHLFRIERIVSILAVELRLAAFRGHGLHHARGGLLDLLFRRLVVGRPHDEPVPRRPDVLDLYRHAVRLRRRFREGLTDVDGPVRAEVGRLDVAVDRHMRRDDVLASDLRERLHPRTLETLVLERMLLHHALFERTIQRAEGIEQVVSELVPACVDRLLESLGDDPQEVLRLLLVLPFLDLLAPLVLVDGLQGEVDVALVLVHLEDLADDLLALAHVVPDVLDPAGTHLGDVDETFLALELVEGHEG